MKKIIAALALLIALAAPGHAQTGSAKTATQLNTEVNQQFADQLIGGITPFIMRQMLLDLIASSGTVLSPTTFSNNVYFGSGRPWCDVRAKGALGNASGDDGPAFQACVNVIAALPAGDVFIPPGNYCIKTTVTGPIGSAIHFLAANQAFLQTCGVDVTIFDLHGAWSNLDSIGIFGKGLGLAGDTGVTFGATNPVVIFEAECVGCIASNSSINGGTGIQILTDDVRFYNVHASQSFGSAIVYVGSASGEVGGGTRFTDSSFDQNWPMGLPTAPISIGAWAATTSYTTPIQNLVTATFGGKSYLLQLKTAGTSGGTTPTLKNYGIDITDGTAVWQLVSPAVYYGFQCDTNCSEINIVNHDFSGSFTSALAMTNTLAGTAPQYVHMTQGTLSQTTSHIVDLQAGNNVTLSNSHVLGCLTNTCAAVHVGSAFGSKAKMDGLFISSVGVGLQQDGGSLVDFSHNNISGTVGNGIDIAANVSLFNLLSNIFSTIGSSAIVVEAGTSDHYHITDNILNGFTFTDGGTGINKTTSPNEAPLDIKNGGTGANTLAAAQAALGYPVIIGGHATIDLNVGTTDTPITITSPTTNYIVQNITVQNKGTTASLTTATLGAFTTTGGGGLALAANQALSAITSNAVNTDANAASLAITVGARTWINSATLQARVGTPQGAAASAEVYVFIRPLP